MQKSRTPQKTDRRREKRIISPPEAFLSKRSKVAPFKSGINRKGVIDCKSEAFPFQQKRRISSKSRIARKSGAFPFQKKQRISSKSRIARKSGASLKETKPLQERRASREKAKIPHAKHQKFPASETPSSDAKQSAISRRLIYFENLARIPKNLLTNRKTHAIIDKHDGSAMPEWRNWQTPGT